VMYGPRRKRKCSWSRNSKAASHAGKEARSRARRPAVVKLAIGLVAVLLSGSLAQAQSSRGAVDYEITPTVSKIKFHKNASVPLEGIFEICQAKLPFASPDPATGILEVKIQADSVHTGSQLKDARLKSENCFDVQHHPYITLSFQQDRADGTA